jgi:DNA repair exonuclease SbcCD ATPase subunit
MITFERIRWKNLLSTGNFFTEIKLNTHKTTLIVGDNGSGKSTLLDALTFVLFGKPFRKINKPQLLNTINKKDMVVEIYFSIGSVKYKIIRGIKPNIFEVYQNDKLLNQSAESKDYQEILEKQILKVNYKSFCQVVVLGSATFQPFMQLTTSQRREVIEDLLDLQIFTTMNTLLKTKVTQNTQELLQEESNKKLIDEKINLIKSHIKDIKNNNEQIIEEKRNIITETEENIKKLNSDLITINEKIKTLSTLSDTEDKLKTKIKDLDRLKHKIEDNLVLVKKDLEFFTNNNECPTCTQNIDIIFKNNTIETKEKESKEITEGLQLLYSNYNKLEIKLKKVLENKKQINDLKLDEYRINNKIQTLNEYILTLQKEINNQKTINTIDNENKIFELDKEMSITNERLVSLNEAKIILSSTGVLLKDSGIKARIIKQYVPIINKLINKYLSALDFYVKFELDEEFSETIKSRHRDDFTYASFSEGEKMKINLAILFTWRSVAKLRNSINTNILIMDEVFDSSLDSNGTEEFLKLINNLTNDTNTFIISHKRDQLVDKFDNVLRVEKKKNFSKVIQ